MAVAVFDIKEAKEQTRKAIDSNLPRLINDLNNSINKESNAGNYEVINSEVVEKYQYTLLSKAAEEFRKNGYYVELDNSKIKLNWK